MLQLTPKWKPIGLTVAVVLLIGLCLYGYEKWRGHAWSAKTEAAAQANARARRADLAARQRPDSTVAGLAGQRRENARYSTSLQHRYDSLLRLRRPLSLPAVPPLEQ